MNNGLFSKNTPSLFWRILPDATPAMWKEATLKAIDLLPRKVSILAEHDWDTIAASILGEEQFGPNRYRLSQGKRLYYFLKPVLPRKVTTALRRLYRGRQEQGFTLAWPIEGRYVRFLHKILDEVCSNMGREHSYPAHTLLPGKAGSSSSPLYRINFWPDGARFAFVLTHDVELASGFDFVHALAAVDEKYGFRSSFNFVPEKYPVDRKVIRELIERGFEVGVHGLKHDGKLFSSLSKFQTRARQINQYLKEWQAAGFRSPLTHRNPEWMQALEIEYDSSFFDTDPYETMRGGTMSIWPFSIGRFTELPYTLIQDHTLMVILGETTPRLWLEKVDFIQRHGGMALVNVHPDYLRDPGHFAIYEEFLQEIKRQNGSPAGNGFWHALPKQVAQWWQARSEAIAIQEDGKWRIPNLPHAVASPVTKNEK